MKEHVLRLQYIVLEPLLWVSQSTWNDYIMKLVSVTSLGLLDLLPCYYVISVRLNVYNDILWDNCSEYMSTTTQHKMQSVFL